MTRAALLALAIAAPAHAGDTAEWLGTGCRLIPTPDALHVAEVNCRNVLTSGAALNEGTMTAGDLAVHVAILHGPGDIPDRFAITPMPGFFAEPPMLTLDENTRGTVLIFEFVGS